MKLPLIESHFLSGFIAMNNLEKKKIASYLALFTICFFVFSAARIIHSTVFTKHLRYATYNAGAGTVVTGGDELLVCQTHVFTYMNIYMCIHILFTDCLNAILNFFFFLYRFGIDMQMINFTTGEFQLTRACPYQVGCCLYTEKKNASKPDTAHGPHRFMFQVSLCNICGSLIFMF